MVGARFSLKIINHSKGIFQLASFELNREIDLDNVIIYPGEEKTLLLAEFGERKWNGATSGFVSYWVKGTKGDVQVLVGVDYTNWYNVVHRVAFFENKNERENVVLESGESIKIVKREFAKKNVGWDYYLEVTFEEV